MRRLNEDAEERNDQKMARNLGVRMVTAWHGATGVDVKRQNRDTIPTDSI